MAAVETVLFIMLLVVLSGFVARMLPISIPLPLVQMTLGGVVAYALDLSVELEPHVFFLLLLPPLLFLDGWRIPKRGLFDDKGTIMEMAFGLVFLTVVAMGLIINWLIPAMPLPVAFALAAILSPTDPIAVAAIASKAKIPHRLMHILEGESLLNDASGLVCMRFAVAAMLTGAFNPGEASLTFVQLVLGGIAIGAGLTWVVTWIKHLITRRFGEEPGAQILTSVLIPFGAYALAEYFHFSGILAAVAAGIAMSYAEMGSEAMASTRMRRTALWDTIQMAANGAIFVILGEQLPHIVESAHETVRATGHESPWWLVLYIGVITLCLGAMRFAWVWVSFRFTLFRRARREAIAAGVKLEKVPKPNWRLVAAMSVAGVRGAITLAGIMTLPLAMNDGTPFPARDLAIAIAAGVIVISLIGATLLLPPLLKGVDIPHDDHAHDDEAVRQAASLAAVQAIENAQHDLATKTLGIDTEDANIHAEVAARLTAYYHQRIENRSSIETDKARETIASETELVLMRAALAAERKVVNDFGRRRKIDESLVHRLVREIDQVEAGLMVRNR